MLKKEGGPKSFVQSPADRFMETLLLAMYKTTFHVQSPIFSVRNFCNSVLLSLAFDIKFMALYIISLFIIPRKKVDCRVGRYELFLE